MKKLLLSVLALGMYAGMYAQTADLSQLIDVTPTAYHFYKNASVDLSALLRTDATSPAAPNMGDVSYITNNPDLFTAEKLGYGSIVIGGPYKDAPADLAKCFSTYDFGGKIGNVLILNGAQSDLAEAIKEKLELDAAPEIAKMGGEFKNVNTFWLQDYYTMQEELEEGDNVLLHIEYNAYNNDMSVSQNVVEQLFEMTEQGGFVTLNVNATFNAFAVEGEWSPENWMVVEAIVPYYELPSYIRQFETANAALNTGALLIRDFGIYGVPAGVEVGIADGVNKTFVTYSLTGGSVGVDSIATENDEIEYYNLQGVKVVNPEKGIYIKKQGNKSTKVVL